MAHTWKATGWRNLPVIRNLNDQVIHQISLWKSKYAIVAEHSDDDDTVDTHSSSEEKGRLDSRWKRSCTQTIVLAVLAALLVLEIIAVAILPHRNSDSSNASPSTASPQAGTELLLSGNRGCGSDYETAVASECQFNPLTIAWEASTCHEPYADIIDDFVQRSDWSVSTDVAGSDQVSWNTVSHGLRRYHAAWDYHFTHCIYTWKMMQRAFEKRLPLADNLLDLKHTRHCLEVLQDDRWSADDTHTLIHVKWPKCYGAGEWTEASYSDQFT